MTAEEYFNDRYGEQHMSMVVAMDDLDSLYSLMDEYHQAKSKEEAEERYGMAYKHVNEHDNSGEWFVMVDALRLAAFGNEKDT